MSNPSIPDGAAEFVSLLAEARAVVDDLRAAEHPDWTMYALAVNEVAGATNELLRQQWLVLDRVRNTARSARVMYKAKAPKR